MKAKRGGGDTYNEITGSTNVITLQYLVGIIKGDVCLHAYLPYLYLSIYLVM